MNTAGLKKILEENNSGVHLGHPYTVYGAIQIDTPLISKIISILVKYPQFIWEITAGGLRICLDSVEYADTTYCPICGYDKFHVVITETYEGYIARPNLKVHISQPVLSRKVWTTCLACEQTLGRDVHKHPRR